VRRLVGAAFLVLLGMASAGCGGDSNTPEGSRSSSSPAAATKTIVVEETEFHVKPSVSRVKLGTYKFKGVNKGTIPHVLELEGPGLENETDTIQPGEAYTIELTLHEPGKYELYCPLDHHKKKGMVTDFVVER
jgi:plastocyanin